MSEYRTNKQVGEYKNSELLECQEVLHGLCRNILALRPNGLPPTFESLYSSIEPIEVRSRLEVSVGDLLLKDGDNFGLPEVATDMPVRESDLVASGLCGWEWDGRKYGGYDGFAYQLDITLAYQGNGHFALETISLLSSEIQERTLPRISRMVHLMECELPDYDGHRQRGRPASSEDEVMEILSVATDIFDQRIRQDPR